jgi:hypothetical protein
MSDLPEALPPVHHEHWPAGTAGRRRRARCGHRPFADHRALLVDAGTGDVDVDMALVAFCDAPTLRALVGDVLAVGDFNDWMPGAHAMTDATAGWTCTLTRPPGPGNRFRYLLDRQRWGGHDPVIDLTRPTHRPRGS